MKSKKNRFFEPVVEFTMGDLVNTLAGNLPDIRRLRELHWVFNTVQDSPSSFNGAEDEKPVRTFSGSFNGC